MRASRIFFCKFYPKNHDKYFVRCSKKRLKRKICCIEITLSITLKKTSLSYTITLKAVVVAVVVSKNINMNMTKRR
jgi:hypothetical protein